MICNRHDVLVFQAARVAATLALVSCGSVELSDGAGSTGAPTSPASGKEASTPARPALAQGTQTKDSWRQIMSRNHVPSAGCFRVSYPSTNWEKIPCVTAPPGPHAPRSASASGAATPNVVGGDFGAFSVNSSTPINESDGSFPEVTGVTSEPDAFSLQLNTNFFYGVCFAPNCHGWQQFIYSNSGNHLVSGSGGTNGALYIEYWLVNYGGCPDGWTPFGNSCYLDSSAVPVPTQTILNLSHLYLGALALFDPAHPSDLEKDYVTLGTADSLYAMSATSRFNLDVARLWTSTQFNVFGDTSGNRAHFNSGTTVAVQTRIDNSHTHPTGSPTCVLGESTTAESNNLNLLPASCCAIGGPGPTALFVESNSAALPQVPFCLLNDITATQSPLF